MVSVPLTVLFGFGIAMLLTRARAGVGVFRTVFYLPALVPPVAATLGFVYLLNPSTGPVNTILGWFGIEGPLWFNDPGWSKPSLVMLGLWGVGTTMIIFLAAILDVPRHLYESAELDGAGRLPAAALGDAADDQPGDPVRGRARRDRVAAVLHPGARRGERRRRARPSQAGTTTTIELGYPEGSTLFYPILVYNHGFRYFNMGYASAMAMLLLVVAFARHRGHHLELAAGRALPGGGAVTRASPQPARRRRAGGCRARFAAAGCSSRSPTTAS